jgi:uncharacterized protein YndB with AHSA1/START domain
MTTTRIRRRLNAPRSKVHGALLDARAVAFRISLTYDAPTGAGKTTAHTDTYHGRFVELVPGERVVEVLGFETADPGMPGEMTITISLADVEGAELTAVHARLPSGLSPADKEAGWRMSLAKLAPLVGDRP